MIKDEAKKLHTDFFGHESEKEMKIELYDMDNLTLLGTCFAVEYIAKKHEDKREERYRHEFEHPVMLLTNGHDLVIYSPVDEIKITKRGIEG